MSKKVAEEVKEVAVVEAPTQAAVVPFEVRTDVDLAELLTSLKEISNKPEILPIKFKDEFTFGDGEKSNEFNAVLLYMHQSNVMFEGRYKPGDKKLPRCASKDGRVPHTKNPISKKCDGCPMNEYKSSQIGGEGKACKNMQSVYLLLEGAVMPFVLRVPPTSIKNIIRYGSSVTATDLSYRSVLTKISVTKESDQQTHSNISFKKLRRLTAEEKKSVTDLYNFWLPILKDQSFAMDPEDAFAGDTIEPNEETDVATEVTIEGAPY